MKNSLLQGLSVFLMMLFTSASLSQGVSGKVSDANGPVAGVSVTEKGTNNSQQTDFDGNYKFSKLSPTGTLVFRFIGFQTQEIAVGGKSTINVTLTGGQEQLNEVLVIGYGKVKRKDATGAIETLSSKKFDNVGAANPAELLRGKVAGVQVTSSNGEPGAAISVRIRGNSSLRSGNGPLIVVDGVPLDGGDSSAGGANIAGTSSPKNPLNFLNQNDIETMSILKDAASTAIYGSRGANGVIMITTKKAKTKEPQLMASSSVGFSTYQGNLDVMSTEQYLAAGGANNGSNYNWKDAILQSAVTTNNDVSYSSGTDKSMTRYSFGASNTEGIVKNTGMDKYTASAGNSTSFFDDFLKIDSKITYAGIRDRTTLLSNNAGFIGNLMGAALYWNPTNPVRDSSPDGYFNPGYSPTTPGSYGADDYLNPVQILDSYSDSTMTNKLIAYINTTFKLTDNLKYQFLFGVDNSNSSRRSQLLPTIRIRDVAQFQLAGTPETATTPAVPGPIFYGQADIININRFSKTLEHIFTYDKQFSDNFKLNLVGGYSYYSYDFNQNSITAKGFAQNQTNLIDNIQGGVGWSNGGGNNFGPVTLRNRVELQSFYARASTNIYKDFNLDFTIRRDGSSKFGENEKYGNFYAVGGAYKVISGGEGIVNDIKLRGSFGVTGNQEFAPNSALAIASFANGPDQGFGSQINANPNLRWETTAQSNIGVDFTLLKNRLSGSLEYFFKSTKDLVFAQPAEATQPGRPGLKFVNLPGSLENQGVEASLTYQIMDKQDFSWDFSINGAFLENTMRDFGLFVETGGLNGQGLSGAFSQVLTNNQAPYSYYLYEWRGYDATGNSIYADAAGNDTGLGTAAKTVLDKSPLPTMNVGFSSSFSYKNFDASVSFYGAFGHYLYNNTANALFFKGAFPLRNITQDVATSTQAVGDPNSPSTKYLESGDFLRMGNLTFGYTFSGGVIERAKIQSARFFVNGQNLLLFTNYTGFDPEVDIAKPLNGVPSAGIDYLAYPRARTISLGLNLNF